MIELHIDGVELYDNERNEFIVASKGGVFQFEHSLLAMSKWESKWKRPFLNVISDKKNPIPLELLKSYLAFMCLDETFTPSMLTDEATVELVKYIGDSNTATTISSNGDSNGKSNIITTEVLYAMMAEGGVPFSCENWNFNRLQMLLTVMAHRANPPKKMSRSELLAQNRRLNAERRNKYKSKG